MPEAISVLIPLLYLIILKLSDISRESDIIAIRDEDTWIVEESIPYFGVFSVVHALNTTILYFVLFGSVRTYDGQFFVEFYRTLSGESYLLLISALTFSLWALLPILELDHSQIPPTNMLEPIQYHFIYVFLVFFLFHPMAYIHSRFQYSTPETTHQAFELSAHILTSEAISGIILLIFQMGTMLLIIVGMGNYFLKLRETIASSE